MALDINEQNFGNIIRSNKVVVVDFFGTWCGPCMAISPMIDQLASEFNGRAVVGKVDVDRSPNLTAQFGIKNIPAILFFQNGVKVDKLGAGVPKSVIAQKINSLL